jgi:NADH:ubiquinone oxidoreductase subunit E
MTARVAAAVIALAVALLTVDYVVARVRTPRDDRLVKTLQQAVKSDAAASARLDAEFKRITAYRRARKLRDSITAYALIAAAAVFLLTVKRPPSLVRRTPWSARDPLVPQKPTRGSAADRGVCPTSPPLDLAFIDDAVTRIGRTREAAIPLLQAIQQHYRYLPDEALLRLCELTEITPAQIAGTSSFYGQFRRSPVGKHIVKVCHGTACHVAGARQITDELRRTLQIPAGADTDPSRTFTLEEVACLGCCSLAPVLMVDEHTAGKLTPSSACGALDAVEQKDPA